ncbi:MAG: hypothetical protein ACK5AZ_17255 [Bryobacteraceae bacterium]
MRTRKLSLECPTCGSTDVFYSCEPKCCFNHVCGECHTTFEPVTHATPQRVSGVLPPDPLPDVSEPTVACAKCESTAVYVLLDDGRLACRDCGAVLELEITEVATG